MSSSKHQSLRPTRAFQETQPPMKNLWRVMDTNKLETLLQGGLWFARLDQFGDEREGSLPTPNLGLLNKLPKPVATWVAEEYERSVLRSYALCWHMSDADPDTSLWQAFSGSGTGVAVRSDYQSLKKAIAPISGNDGPVHFSSIHYIDHDTDTISDHNVIDAAFTVRNEFSYEREARILIHTHGTAAFNSLYGRKGPLGLLVVPSDPSSSSGGGHELTGGHANGRAIVISVKPKELIHEVLLGSNMTEENRKSVRLLLARYDMGSRIRVSPD